MLKGFRDKFQIFDIVAILFSAFWIVVLLLDYFNKHPIYYESLIHFKYSKLLCFLVAYGALYTWWIDYSKKKNKALFKYSFMGTNLISLMIVILATCISFTKYYTLDVEIGDYIHILGMSMFVLTMGLFILFSCYCLGRRINETFYFGKVYSKAHFTIDLAIGIMVLTLVLFPIAWFHLLHPVVVVVLLLILIAFNYQIAYRALINIVQFEPGFNKIQLAIFYTAGVFALFNFIFILSPYPLGFDSRNLYINLPLLIAQNHGLVQGFQPYNWELFESLGKIVSGKTEVTMFLSQIGGLLAAITTFHLATRFGKLSKTNALIIAILIIVTPAIARQAYIELKVDLGLLFIQICTVVVFISHVGYKSKSNKSKLLFCVLIGAMLGFGLSIKLLNILLIYGIILAMSIDKDKMLPILAVGLLGAGLVFFLRLDEASGLRYYHKYVNELSYLLIIAGLILGGIYSFKNMAEAKLKIVQMVIVLFTTLLVFSPWMYKTYKDTNNSNVLGLIKGSKAGHDLDFKRLDNIYKELSNE